MKGKIVYMQKSSDVDTKIHSVLDGLNVTETTTLLKNIDIGNTILSENDLRDIKKKTFHKLNMATGDQKEKGSVQPGNFNSLSHSVYIKSETKSRNKNRFRIRFAAAAVAVLLCIVMINYNDIAHAFWQMLSLIPGVGIIENNSDSDREILYQLKETVNAESDQATMTISSAVATSEEISVNFQIVRKNYTEDELFTEKQKEWEELKKGGEMKKPRIFLQVDNQKFTCNYSSSGGGLEENYSCTFKLDSELIGPAKRYKLIFDDYNISADFELVTLEQYNSLSDIGPTEIHNNISLTATASREGDQLKVHIYPLNYSDYTLISFDQEYEFDYFHKKLTLKTDKGDKDYTLPGSYGSGMNAAYTFDLSDGAKYSILSVPYVVVESQEEKRITLPIPKEGKVVSVNQEVAFEDGSVIIKDVEKLVYPHEDNESDYDADLKVNLEYKSKDEKKQLVGAKLTNKKSESMSWEYDEDHRLTTYYYTLDNPSKSQIKLYLTKPRYVLMDEYNLDISKKPDTGAQ
ncbi:MAG: hypothetical protein ACFWTJ_14235 [Lachnoclostridium sp.]|jgi:uncharacterized protein YqkB